jgi:hypothetical protein
VMKISEPNTFCKSYKERQIKSKVFYYLHTVHKITNMLISVYLHESNGVQITARICKF